MLVVSLVSIDSPSLFVTAARVAQAGANPRLPSSLKSRQSWLYPQSPPPLPCCSLEEVIEKMFETQSWVGGQGLFSMPDPRPVETVKLICRRKNKTQSGPGVRIWICLSLRGRQPALISIPGCTLEAGSLMALQQSPKRKCLGRTKHSQASPGIHLCMVNRNKPIIKSISSVKEQCIPTCLSKSGWHYYLTCWQIHGESSQPTPHDLKSRGCI